MSVAILLAVLAMFDAMLAGFRAAAGRDGRIDKRAYFRAAMIRAGVLGIVLVAANAGLVALLVTTSESPTATWQAFIGAGTTCVWVFGGFATATLVALGFWFAPVPEHRLLASVIVLGPLTMLRPIVIVGGLVAAAAGSEARVWIAATLAGASMLGFEWLVGRAHARRWRRLTTASTTGPS